MAMGWGVRAVTRFGEVQGDGWRGQWEATVTRLEGGARESAVPRVEGTVVASPVQCVERAAVGFPLSLAEGVPWGPAWGPTLGSMSDSPCTPRHRGITGKKGL